MDGIHERNKMGPSGGYSLCNVPFFSSSRYCPIARISSPARRKYPARIARSACGNIAASLSTCRWNAGSITFGAGDPTDEWPGRARANSDGRRGIALCLWLLCGLVGDCIGG